MRPSFVSLRSRSGHPVHIYTVGGDVTRATGDLILDLGGQQASRGLTRSTHAAKVLAPFGLVSTFVYDTKRVLQQKSYMYQSNFQ
ncbi:hypothetical protein CIHG_06827 [Coccidioides immitis H538.4]|uniref:Uncharacterized protein n=3 Tax=Coccidioides immitis TaxID=5501 RepID=A0A0J8QZH4_COCIT|nr:hypothetical protein CIRG_04377 [Coccidioides immitis RMSCC 2394]KMU77465.1 hypothetical protein CISG_06467 [Coccidioides immitis RMSCC 3703]KMU89025.1 hypothetical protein CIHG_06827 [Coccidioides immitis H538.4]